MRWMLVIIIGFPFIDKLGIALYNHDVPAPWLVPLTENPSVVGRAAQEMSWGLFTLLEVVRMSLGPLGVYLTTDRSAKFFETHGPCAWQWRPKFMSSWTRRLEHASNGVLLGFVYSSAALEMFMPFGGYVFSGIVSIASARGLAYNKKLAYGSIGAVKVYLIIMYIETGAAYNIQAIIQHQLAQLV